jgi:D-threo-aldose 1-dehydrogenase
MLDLFVLPNGRTSTALGFGCASLLRLTTSGDRQRLLDCAVDHGIRHFDVARLYGLGLAEAELAPLLRRHRSQLTLATKFGLGDAGPPSAASQRQGSLRQLLRLLPGLVPMARRLYGRSMVLRNFSAAHCRQSLHTSLCQLGLEAVDLFLLHEPTTADCIDPNLEATLQDLQREGLIGSYGLSGAWPDCEQLMATRPALAGALVQWEDDLLEPGPAREAFPTGPPRLLGRFGRIRRSLVKIQQSFAAVPQLQHHWSERLNLHLADADALGAALLGAALASYPGELLLYASTDADRLGRTLAWLNDPPWQAADAIAFETFWRSHSSPSTLP